MAETKLMTREEVVDLASCESNPCISIYVPTQRHGKEAAQGGIHLKNLLAEVESQLADDGLRWDEIEALTSGARPMISDPTFWQHQAEGLAIFLSKGQTKVFKLPVPVQARQSISDRFEITPLLPMLSGDGRFYILAVSANDVRLFDATRYGYDEVFVEDLPRGMAEALWADDHERQLQFHSGAGESPKGGGRSAMYFGTGDEGNMERKKVDFKRYFDKVDAVLAPIFKQHPAPVILAGVGYLLPIYRQANTSAKLLEGEVHGNQDRSTADDLHEACWEIAGEHFEKVNATAVERFRELMGTGLASADGKAISEAAASGRVETLFISRDMSSDQVQHANVFAIQTMQNGGTILALPGEEMPAEQPVAATFRY